MRLSSGAFDRLSRELESATRSRDPQVRLHRLRVLAKRVRASWMLVARSYPKTASQELEAVRRATRALASERDADVLTAALRDLNIDPDSRCDRRARRGRLAPSVRSRREAALALRLHRSIRLLRRLPLHPLSLAAARLRLLAAYRDAHGRPGPKRLHRLRKALKAMQYQAELVRPRPASAIALARREARRLGEARDLSALLKFLEAAGETRIARKVARLRSRPGLPGKKVLLWPIS